MFKRFNKEDFSSNGQVKSSVRRGIRCEILEQYPRLESVMGDIFPQKASVEVIKIPGHVQVVVLEGEPIFFSLRDGQYFPTLRVLHQYPGFMSEVQVDKGAIRFVLGGANIMCPGLTSKGGKMEDELPEGTAVAIRAEGKEMELALGLTKMSTTDIREKNKGIAIELIHYVNDGLWRTEFID
ncbi:pseudouridine synthase and archaeosine transglycosylase domain-containing protein [Nannochloropsis oceanica]